MTEETPLMNVAPPTKKLFRKALPSSQYQRHLMTLLKGAQDGLASGHTPRLIPQGSSGSYMLYDSDKRIIAVFKPKNEEPYGRMNPKWLKMMHRACLPCLFGRSCIIPNKGYLSEAGAYIVDQLLQLNIVPPTFITTVTSDAFNYPYYVRHHLGALSCSASSNRAGLCEKSKSELPPKLGSFQMFVSNYENCYAVLDRLTEEAADPEVFAHFQFLFQKMVVLDYIIRNTDRNDNWLIKLHLSDPTNTTNGSSSSPAFSLELPPDHAAATSATSPPNPSIQLAAIDNGLAFPFKHPDSWRSYPFRWGLLPVAKLPFLDSIKSLVLENLSNEAFLQKIEHELLALFETDKSFDRLRFDQQVSVLRGQVVNLCSALHEGLSPNQLIAMRPIYVTRHTESPGLPCRYTQRPHEKHPFFKCW